MAGQGSLDGKGNTQPNFAHRQQKFSAQRYENSSASRDLQTSGFRAVDRQSGTGLFVLHYYYVLCFVIAVFVISES